jgi:hypothetical protein
MIVSFTPEEEADLIAKGEHPPTVAKLYAAILHAALEHARTEGQIKRKGWRR